MNHDDKQTQILTTSWKRGDLFSCPLQRLSGKEIVDDGCDNGNNTVIYKDKDEFKDDIITA